MNKRVKRLVDYFPKKIWLVLGAGAVRKGSLSHSLSVRLIAPTGVVERVYFASLVSIKHLANEPVSEGTATKYWNRRLHG